MRSTYSFQIITLVFCLTIVAYFPALDVPFYLDDFQSVVDNSVIRSINLTALSQSFPLREVGYLSFALNYATTELDLGALHLTNILLHIMAGLSVFSLTLLVTKSAKVEETKANYIAIISTILFLFSPVNSQAVIYIVQRLAVIVAIFYIFCLITYIKFRTETIPWKKSLWLLLCLCSFFLGLHSKQNIVTLPLVILVIELLLIKPQSMAKLPKYLISAFMACLLFWLFDFILETNFFAKIDALTREADRITRWEYFTHQVTAIWIYTFKFFIPTPLLLEYSSTPLTWSDNVTWFSFLGHIIVLTFAVKRVEKQSLYSALIFSYYLAHFVESSLIPISDLMFEHRAYLPNVFLAILTALTMHKLLVFKKWLPLFTVAAVAGVFSVLIIQRINLWKEPIEFYRHEIVYTADNARIYGALGALLAQNREFREAEQWYKAALQVGAETKHLQSTTVIHYLKVLIQNDQISKASRVGVQSLNMLDKPKDKADVLLLLANLKAGQGLCSFSEGLAARAINIYPKYSQIPEIGCVDSKFGIE